jgi:hypothetical protein
MIRSTLLLAALFMGSPAMGQSFSCNFGTRPSCLGYGDTVCSSTGMCVNRNSACFDRYQCDFEGFTCRSNVTECVATHDRLLRMHNELVRDFNENLEVVRRMSLRLSNTESCLLYATTLEAAKLCAR